MLFSITIKFIVIWGWSSNSADTPWERMIILRKELTMFPPTLSSHEIYGKHRNPEEIREIERQERILKTRTYLYGDPVNTPVQPDADAGGNWHAPYHVRKPRYVLSILGFFSHFLSFLTPRA
jgi:hypothetical protein